ncbi:MAG: hypothetical protein HY270_21160 [Deltaproteobacteria bacterium]|nr:hypothetical protein [Deltaproteobacteria bacterium]
METRINCGPVVIDLTADSALLCERAVTELEQFESRWAGPCAAVRVHLQVATEPAAMLAGKFLYCREMRVDKTAGGFAATCVSGAAGFYDASRHQWTLDFPIAPKTSRACEANVDDEHVEDLLELVLTTAWRESGWVPLHAGAVARNGCCAILAAPSRGGKSTLTAALLHRGWRTLGDDKILIRMQSGGAPELRGLTTQFNLDPRTSRWFREVGDLESQQPLSRWTAKRRVAAERIWGDCFVAQARPTHIVEIRRDRDPGLTRATPLSATEVLSVLLHQTVVPADAAIAKGILAVLAPSARQLNGVRLEIGEDAYSNPKTFETIEAMLA